LDTAKDARILVLEDALRRLNEVVNNRKLKFHIEYSKLGQALKVAGSLIYEVKYSYQSAEQLADSEATKNLVEAISDFESLFEQSFTSSAFSPKTLNDKLVLAEVRYSLRIVRRFPEKLRHFDDDPAYAIDVLAVEVTQIQPVKDSDKLTECRCTDGSRIWPIVTNIQNIKQGTKLVCGVLPPVEMMGVISEAMFLGGELLADSVDLGLLDAIPASAMNQARAQVLEITKRMT